MDARLDPAVVRKAQSGDASARALVESRCRQLFERVLARRKLATETREEIVQQALVVVVAKLHDFRWAASFETWAIAVLLRVCHRYLEAEALRRRRVILGSEMGRRQAAHWEKNDRDPANDAPAAALQAALRAALADCLRLISLEMRDVWARHRLWGWGHHRIAAGLSLSMNTVATRIYRVDRKIRACLESKGFTPDVLGVGM